MAYHHKDSPASSTSSSAPTARDLPQSINNKAQETTKNWRCDAIQHSEDQSTTPKTLPRLPARRQVETALHHGGRVTTVKMKGAGDFMDPPMSLCADSSVMSRTVPPVALERDVLSREVAAAVKGFYAGMNTTVAEDVAAVRSNLVRLTSPFQQSSKERSNRMGADLSPLPGLDTQWPPTVDICFFSHCKLISFTTQGVLKYTVRQ
eukprot:820380-Amphidinium_carterae.1